jgi:hypothetical protein
MAPFSSGPAASRAPPEETKSQGIEPPAFLEQRTYGMGSRLSATFGE